MNVETALVEWLTGEGVAVSMDVPSKRPPRFVTVERTGGSPDRWLDRPTVAVQVWGESRVKAADYASAVCSLLWRFAVEHPRVGRLSLSGPYNFPDPDSRQARYQIAATFVTV